jgi:nucleotide-binding universal stress UspA family protein
MRKVLLAINGRVGAEAVLAVYRSLGRGPESVVLVHVRRPGDAAERIMDFTRQEIERCGPVIMKSLVREGVPAEEILMVAREENVDLIVIGRNRTAGRRASAGRVTQEVERAATVPVLVAKTGGSEKSITNGWRGESYAA